MRVHLWCIDDSLVRDKLDCESWDLAGCTGSWVCLMRLHWWCFGNSLRSWWALFWVSLFCRMRRFVGILISLSVIFWWLIEFVKNLVVCLEYLQVRACFVSLLVMFWRIIEFVSLGVWQDAQVRECFDESALVICSWLIEFVNIPVVSLGFLYDAQVRECVWWKCVGDI